MKWILCSERMPKRDIDVLVTRQYKDGRRDTDVAYYLHGEWYIATDEWTIDNVIAWAHLPKPYKGDI